MKIGDYVTVDEVMNQSACRWVVLSDLQETELGGIKGGTIRFIADTKTEAGNMAVKLEQSGHTTYTVNGALDALCVGGVFVE